jgi:putative DNA primase/helicase
MRAETIAKALKGHKTGDGWAACCPAHNDHTPSLSIRYGREGKVLVHCFAGCEQGQVIAALKARGLWVVTVRPKWRQTITRISDHYVAKQLESKITARAEDGLGIWRDSVPAAGTLLAAYLHSRGLDIIAPAALRFHAKLKHPSGTFWPAMVALVTRGTDNTPLAIHRTFIAPDGRSKAAVEPAKMMLGPCRGGAVQLALPTDVLMVGEGIETCLAAMLASGHAAWAALSTSGLRSLDLPTAVQDVIVLADGDDPGEAAARDAALRWHREGRHVRIARPPRGTDFNDLLLGATV